jgi:hypothetical protein
MVNRGPQACRRRRFLSFDGATSRMSACHRVCVIKQNLPAGAAPTDAPGKTGFAAISQFIVSLPLSPKYCHHITKIC